MSTRSNDLPARNTIAIHPEPRRHRVVSRQSWLKARLALLEEEKDLTHRRDRLNAKRRELPWVRVEKSYVFEGPDGRIPLADLFGGRSQLIVQHFMMGPGWVEGCVGCSFLADHIDGARVHLENHGVTVAAISRAPWQEIAPFKARMGWRFPWVSSCQSDFNFDYQVSFTAEDRAQGVVEYNYHPSPYMIEELGGTSVFYKGPDDVVYHTYSCYARGDELLLNTYNFLDLTPLGRNENGPSFDLTDWVRHHDRYEETRHGAACACGGTREGGNPA